LGGIAKGFAVDRAVEALRRAEIGSGLVNAGGDLRSFGESGHRVHLRDPRDPRRMLGTVTLREAALASTACLFDPYRGAGVQRSAVVDPRRPSAPPAFSGATVCASSGMWADGLTKVVMIAGPRALDVLDHYDASAMLCHADGEITITDDWA